ncbi:MAG: peroxiredoxin [Gammaproteobacteria bacterium]|nr:peroxiredoxin [Gammaproteobacteria bacterium]
MISIGEKLPSTEVTLVTGDTSQTITTGELFAGKRAVMFGVPGAFTPVCSGSHLPGFVILADKIKAEGIDLIACLSVNDAFVMRAWAAQQNAEEIAMLADVNAQFTKAMGVGHDRPDLGGVRCQRFSMIVDDGTVTLFNLEKPRAFEVSDAETILQALGSER